MAKARSVAFRLDRDFFLSFLCETPSADRTSLPDDHASIVVLGEHAHKAGEWMISYRLTVEIGLPLYQDLDGPQLKSDYSFTIG